MLWDRSHRLLPFIDRETLRECLRIIMSIRSGCPISLATQRLGFSKVITALPLYFLILFFRHE